MRFPYVDPRINFDIRDAREEQILNDILAMNYEDLMRVNGELQLAANLNYPCLAEHWHSVKVRAAYYRVTVLKAEGKFGPTPTLGDFMRGWVRGWLLADEFWKRH
jgi:hypothetical protein